MVEHQWAESHLKKLENEFNHFSLPLLYLFNTHDILMSLLGLTGNDLWVLWVPRFMSFYKPSVCWSTLHMVDNCFNWIQVILSALGRSETWGLNLKLTKSQTDKVMSKAVRMGNAANSTCPIYRSDSWVIFHCMCAPHLLYPFLCQRTFRLFLCPWVLYIVLQWASFQIMVFSGCMPTSGIIFSHKRGWNNTILNDIDGPRDCHTEWSKGLPWWSSG